MALGLLFVFERKRELLRRGGNPKVPSSIFGSIRFDPAFVAIAGSISKGVVVAVAVLAMGAINKAIADRKVAKKKDLE